MIEEIRSIPQKKVILVTGSPGAGKSTFCQQVVLKNLAEDSKVIYTTTESTSEDLLIQLSEKGWIHTGTEDLNILDAYTHTVGLSCGSQSGVACAHCADLNSISMGVTKLQTRLGDQNLLLVFDSLTSPYLFNGVKVLRFIQQFLAKFAQEGNRVLVTLDKGCGKSEDMEAIKSICDGIIQIALDGNEQTFQVVKHPTIAPKLITQPLPQDFRAESMLEEFMDSDFIKMYMRSLFAGKTTFRPRLGDFVNAFWPKLAYWSGMLWDPEGFPMMIYNHNREDQSEMGSDDFISIVPQPYKTRLRLIKLFKRLGLFPRQFDGPGAVEKLWRYELPYSGAAKLERYAKIEYLADKSKPDEYYYRLYENSDCWDLENIGSTIASYLPPAMSGNFMGIEDKERVWNAVETKCIGLGDPYCEVRITPGETDQVAASLIKDPDAVYQIHERLLEKYVTHILEGETLTNRQEFGPDIHLQIPFHNFGFAHLAGDRSRIAIRMGGVKTGKELAERLLNAGLLAEEAIEKVLKSLEDLKAGVVSTSGNKITIEENIEPMRTWYMTHLKELSCHFTTGFLNGLFKAAHNLRIKEIKCLAAGDPVCEWEIL